MHRNKKKRTKTNRNKQKLTEMEEKTDRIGQEGKRKYTSEQIAWDGKLDGVGPIDTGPSTD